MAKRAFLAMINAVSPKSTAVATIRGVTLLVKEAYMENLQNNRGIDTGTNEHISETAKRQIESERKITNNIMSIRLTPDGLIIKDGAGKHDTTHTTDHLPGVYCQGVMYYDLNNVHYINNTGMAILIDLLKSLLEMDVVVQFVNVDEKIKQRIREMGLENIINCDENSKN